MRRGRFVGATWQCICIAIFVLMFPIAATGLSAIASWTDFMSSTQSNASGIIRFNDVDISVDVTSTSALHGVQTGSGTNLWTGDAYTKGFVTNAPTAGELVRLDLAGTVSIHFSKAVRNPLIALLSWNTIVADFNGPIEVVSNGEGWYGKGTPIVNAAGTGFFGSGEVHGIIKLLGDYETVTFTHSQERWHGFNIGITALASPSEPPMPPEIPKTPEPSSIVIFAAGTAICAFARRKRRTNSNAI